MQEISKTAVIGAGVMGASIAAHMANGGVEVVLLDMVAKEGDNRNAIASGAVGKMLKAEPAPFTHNKNAELITTGNLEDNLGLLADCDWIVEAVIEDADIKRQLYVKIDGARKAGSIVSSNTSTLPLSVLTQGMAESLKRDFLISHFFNPPRYMRLLEIVAGADTRLDAADAVRRFADISLGKSVVDCKDTPGFIANRIGTFWLQCAVTEAMDRGIGVEQVDAIIGRPMGIPKTGVFGLLDLVGLDLMPHVLGSFEAALPPEDAFHGVNRQPELIKRMIADGYTGRKGKGGFYRLNTEGGKKVKEVIDLQTGDYHAAARPRPDAVKAAVKGGLRTMVEYADEHGRYGWRVVSQTLSYAASLVPEIADDIAAVDEAMRLGYNWKFGPFELIDQLGPAWLAAKLKNENRAVPDLLRQVKDGTFYRTREGRLQYFALDGTYHNVARPKGVLLLADIKRKSKPIAKNISASLWDIGDGVACLEFTSKMNSLNPFILWMIGRALRDLPGRGFKAMVIYNEGSNFSVGANIALLLYGAKLHLWPFVRWMLKFGQRTFSKMKYAPFPVVGAPSGMALGGGCEILLHCDAVEAHVETYMGLVEAGVGIVPGWGGCKEMLCRWTAAKARPGGPMPPVMKSFATIAMAEVAKSARQAKDLMFLRPADGIVMNHDRVLARAKKRALEMATDYTPPEPCRLNLPGPTAGTALDMAIRDFIGRGVASAHDGVIGGELARVLSGGDTDVLDAVSEARILELERDAIINLIKTAKTRARIESILKTGKPLRN
jgi:3-hydroxyacyl-CoA dehydrogenase